MNLPKAPNVTTYNGKLVIFTAFYDFRAYAPYVMSLVETAIWLERLGIDWEFKHVFGDFHFDRALNRAMTEFMESDATDIILIDSDEQWSPEGILRLLTHDVDVVCGAYRMKNEWERYTGEIEYGDTGVPRGITLPDGTPLLEAKRVTGGFTRFTKAALKAFADAYPDLHCQDGTSEFVAFFHTGIRDGIFYSHDYLLSERWREAGVQLWIDPSIEITHYGTKGYPGNLMAFLQRKMTTADAIDIVKDMAHAATSAA